MNTDDKLLIAKAAFPDKYKAVFDRFRKSLNAMPSGDSVPDASINDSLATSIGNDWDWLPQGIDSPETRENICHELKISVGWVDEEQEWFVAGPIFEHEYERICHTKEEINAAINECALAILKQEKE